MDERINRIAALVNVSAYDTEASKKYIVGAPHIKHDSLRKLYGKLVIQAFDSAAGSLIHSYGTSDRCFSSCRQLC